MLTESIKRWVPPALGLLAGARITSLALESMPRPTVLNRVWALVAVTLTTVAGAVFVYGTGVWRDLPRTTRPRLGVVVPPAILYTLALIAGSTVATFLLPEGATNRWVAPSLVTVAIVGAFPAVCVAFAIRWDASAPATEETRLQTALRLLALRRTLWRLLGAAGALVVLVTLALSVSIKAQVDRRSPEEGSIIVLLTGSFGSAAVAVIYVPSAAALRRRGEELCESVIGNSREEDDEANVIKRLESYQKLRQLLEVDRATMADLEAGIIILGPLMTAGLSTFLRP